MARSAIIHLIRSQSRRAFCTTNFSHPGGQPFKINLHHQNARVLPGFYSAATAQRRSWSSQTQEDSSRIWNGSTNKDKELKAKLDQLLQKCRLSALEFVPKFAVKVLLEHHMRSLKINLGEGKSAGELSQLKSYVEEMLQLLAKEKNLWVETEESLWSQLKAEKKGWKMYQEFVEMCIEGFENRKRKIEEMESSLELKEKSAFSNRESDTDVLMKSFIEVVREKEELKKQLEETRAEKQKLEFLCRSVQTQMESMIGQSRNDLG